VPKVVLVDAKRPPTIPIHAATGLRHTLRLKQGAFFWVLKNTTKLTHKRHGKAAQVALIWPWLGKLAQAPPSPTRRMNDHRPRAVIRPGVSLHVVHLDIRQRLVMAVGAGKQNGYCHLCSHGLGWSGW
jgi:hypothetical protein